MNTEIKFKAWNVRHQSMSKPFNLYDAMRGGNSISYAGRYGETAIYLQFTGLKDNEGNEMYCGDIFDIMQTVNGQSKFVLMGIVGGFDVRYAHDLNRKYEYDVNDLLKPDNYSGEVEWKIVGHIYEHPQLIEKQPA